MSTPKTVTKALITASSTLASKSNPKTNSEATSKINSESNTLVLFSKTLIPIKDVKNDGKSKIYKKSATEKGSQHKKEPRSDLRSEKKISSEKKVSSEKKSQRERSMTITEAISEAADSYGVLTCGSLIQELTAQEKVRGKVCFLSKLFEYTEVFLQNNDFQQLAQIKINFDLFCLYLKNAKTTNLDLEHTNLGKLSKSQVKSLFQAIAQNKHLACVVMINAKLSELDCETLIQCFKMLSENKMLKTLAINGNGFERETVEMLQEYAGSVKLTTHEDSRFLSMFFTDETTENLCSNESSWRFLPCKL
jgi:hypothetical protein